MEKQTLCLIFGGKSSEYFVSLRSASCILHNIRREKYHIYKVGITREGGWYLYLGDEDKIENDTWRCGSRCYPLSIDLSDGAFECKAVNLRFRPNIIFPVMHGENCEDGAIQGFFDILGIHYVGCGKEASVLGINKHLTKLLATNEGIPVAPYTVVNSHTPTDFFVKKGEEIGYPLYVKASCCGSSVGVYRVKEKNMLIPSVRRALAYSSTALIEKEICGVETEIAVLRSNGKLTLGKIGQIRHKGEFYDYDTKYNSDNVELIIPAPLSANAEEKIRSYAERIFLAIGGSGLSRVDFFVHGDDVIFNEINTMPGFTSGSMYPVLMREEGGSISDLIDKLLMNEI